MISYARVGSLALAQRSILWGKGEDDDDNSRGVGVGEKDYDNYKRWDRCWKGTTTVNGGTDAGDSVSCGWRERTNSGGSNL